MSSANQSRRSCTDHTPVLLIQPPRLVDEATSGLQVTTRAAASGASRLRSASSRPSAAWVETGLRCAWPSAVGTATCAGGATGVRRSAAPRSLAELGRGAAAARRPPRVVEVVPDASASARICASVSSAEWLFGWPSVGSPRPLTV